MNATNHTLNNASMANSFNSTGGLVEGMIILLVYIVVVMVAAQIVAPWLADLEVLSAAVGRFLSSVAYAVKGLAASAVLTVLALPVWLFATADGETQGLALEVVAVVIGAYIALVIVGVLADRATAAFIDAHPEYEEWADIFPEESEDAEVEPADD